MEQALSSPEFFLYLPQMRMSYEAIVERARNAEAAGFDGIGLMDHLAPPGALDQPMYEAMVTSAWLAAHTDRMKIGHLVLCDSFRHPALLAREAVSLDHASKGRFELGIGWGSVPQELETYRVGSTDAKTRVERLAETLAVLRALWSGETVDFEGRFHRIESGLQRPGPLSKIPIVIGGAGPATLRLVAEYADWWNLPLYAIDRIDELKPHTGNARTSLQQMVAFVPSEDKREEVTETARRRFGTYGSGLVIGNRDELHQHFSNLVGRGVERFYVWFADFAPAATISGFGELFAGMRS
jgi:alkanesulfonate monooxygenase SsuD/methylene tetrahydromethanopterin reductase-like flavin-dependent oxidoreductase (luciferase family)